jgi:hypothetical protein
MTNLYKSAMSMLMEDLQVSRFLIQTCIGMVVKLIHRYARYYRIAVIGDTSRHSFSRYDYTCSHLVH